MSYYNTTNKNNWEARSTSYQNNLNGVLFKRFPHSLNNHIHNFHKRFILENIPNQNNLKILDVGCGYGRNALILTDRNPNIELVGIDISENYVNMFKANTNQSEAFVATLEDLPPEIRQVDYILCVTVLMYVAPADLNRALQNMLARLKPNGKIILIEPLVFGKFFSSVFGLTMLFNANTIGERSFYAKQLKKELSENGGIIVKESRLPVTTLFILPLYLLSLVLNFKIMDRFFNTINKVDNFLSDRKLPSLYTSLVIEKVKIKN